MQWKRAGDGDDAVEEEESALEECYPSALPKEK